VHKMWLRLIQDCLKKSEFPGACGIVRASRPAPEAAFTTPNGRGFATPLPSRGAT
jgi:hypothetical protein